MAGVAGFWPALADRLFSVVRIIPRATDWLATLFVGLLLAPLLGACLLASNVMQWQPVFDAATLQLALIALVIPALGEELLFRAAIFPRPAAGDPMPQSALLISTIAFVLWHPLQAFLFGGARSEIFLDPFFLVAVALLGIGCAWLYWRTRSIWPPVVLHWLAVVGWKSLAGGPPLV